MTITIACHIKPYSAPQYLVEPTGPVDQDELAALNEGHVEILDRTLGWGYSYIIRVTDDDGYQHDLLADIA